jgi:hypothetical protein
MNNKIDLLKKLASNIEENNLLEKLIMESDRRNKESWRTGNAPQPWTKEDIAKYQGLEHMFKKKTLHKVNGKWVEKN